MRIRSPVSTFLFSFPSLFHLQLTSPMDSWHRTTTHRYWRRLFRVGYASTSRHFVQRFWLKIPLLARSLLWVSKVTKEVDHSETDVACVRCSWFIKNRFIYAIFSEVLILLFFRFKQLEVPSCFDTIFGVLMQSFMQFFWCIASTSLATIINLNKYFKGSLGTIPLIWHIFECL